MIQTNSDGGARGNPGPGAIGVIVRRENEILIRYSGGIGQRITNNQAEYEALIKALELAIKVKDKEVECFLDSELVVKQLLGEYKVKNPILLQSFLKVQKLIENFDKIKFTHVSRWDTYQQIADELLNNELDSLGYGRYRGYKGTLGS
ncbi:ribonuclease HI family protein [archaeon]|jgi:ribonuclease HI|nr:ribonuclease HI family protein [archaeon]MBT4373288.1 ribonuclease HI family protein [archaeon]MBT4531633.1 ribonuclease HI family protein [archaeon]MBT7001189.1 ribonuclease HI family protein [archaeon]MBT7282325.1 ribonuclease HI family protein [archaeon]